MNLIEVAKTHAFGRLPFVEVSKTELALKRLTCDEYWSYRTQQPDVTLSTKLPVVSHRSWAMVRAATYIHMLLLTCTTERSGHKWVRLQT